MGIMQRFRLLRERFAPTKVEMPSRVIESDAPRINDGLDYALPVLLPQFQREQLEKSGKLNAWLTEQVRDTYNLPFDDPAYRMGDVLSTLVIEDPLREWNWSTRTRVLSSTHSAYSRNPIAKRAVHYVSAFVVGEGFNLVCKNKDVEQVLQDFIDNPDNAIREYERQAPRDLMVDGELLTRFYEQDGEVVAVPMRPWEVQYIQTEDGFFRRALNYHVQPYSNYNSDDPQSAQQQTAAYDVKAADVVHVAINRHAYELRGRPELYSALPWLRAHKEWLENRARQNHWRGALLWWVKIASAVPGVIAAKLAQYQRPPTPGSTVVTSDKEEWSALTNPVGAGEASEDGRQLKIMALNGIAGIPEYMTGDGENANLATSKSQQLPVLTTFGEFQTILIEQLWIPMFKRVLTVAIEAGLLPEEVEEQDADGDPVLEDPPDTGEPTPMIAQPGTPPPEPAKEMPAKKLKTLDAFEVQYEPVGGDDIKTLADALDVAAANGWVSAQTATTELGFDFAIEQKRIKKERKANNEAMMRGEIPLPPEVVPPELADEGANDPANKKAA